MTYLPVKGYEGLYEVDDHGNVRSVDRTVVGRDGVQYHRRGRVLRPVPNKNVGYLQVSLWADNVGTSHYVHRLVAEAHIPNPEGLPEVNHINGIRSDPRKENLEWVNSVQNKTHAIETGLRVYTHRLTKSEFIECLESVISGESYINLSRRVPYKVPFLSVKLRKLAMELGIEGELNESLMQQRIARARVNGSKNRQTD